MNKSPKVPDYILVEKIEIYDLISIILFSSNCFNWTRKAIQTEIIIAIKLFDKNAMLHAS